MKTKNTFILDLRDIDQSMRALVGGKGANLGALTKIDGVRVPDGFCITTQAYREIICGNGEFTSLLDRLVHLKADDRKAIGETSASIRKVIEEIPIPENLGQDIT